MITVTILVKNAESTLRATLESLSGFPEILLFDTGSTDKTLDIAREFPQVAVIQSEFIGFGPTHNLASQKASYDWILSIDSDEILSPELSKEILSLPLDPHAVYAIRRRNFFNNRWIRGCSGWDPDWVVRLYHRKKTSFSQDQVHEKVLTHGLKTVKLTSPLLHTPYLKIEHFLSKMQVYSSLFAKQHKNKRSASIGRALLHSWAAFFKSYFLKKGCLNGKEGLIISLYNGHTAFYKYLKLMED